MMSKSSALYIHIPFCHNICTYCDFKKFIYNQKMVDEYFESLFLESNKLNNKKYHTIYIGGGTPSSIDRHNLESLLTFCQNHLKNKNFEFTIECNVEDINEDLLILFRKYSINRLSIGVQTFNEKFIKFCNRKHNKKMAIDNINLASKYFKNVSIDLIYAFPTQTINELADDLKIAMTLPIVHISYYSLLIEDNTILKNNGYQNVSDDVQTKMYKRIYKTLKNNGFHRYEISNFAKYKKYESKHNKTYWQNKHYDAIGLGASGYIDNQRYTNTINLTKYLKHDFSNSSTVDLTLDDKLFEEIMLGLRLDEGINIKKLEKKYHFIFKEKYRNALLNGYKYHLINKKNGFIKTTFKGSLLLNSLLVFFLEC